MAIAKDIPSIWTTGWTDVLNTGTWRSAIPEHRRRLAPCQNQCPVDGEIPVWVQQVKNEKYLEAWQTLVENNPFPAVSGRICHHPCEQACNRGEYDEAVTVNALEQFVGDIALQEGWALPEPISSVNKRVAVIGGGPAGLSCAYQLRRQGLAVTVFEMNEELGGVMRYGIPEYRLPKSVLRAEISRLLALGIETVTKQKVSGAELDSLTKEYDAVFLAIGASESKTLPQFAAVNGKVLAGLDFLGQVTRGENPRLGREVAVIGGGSVAMDVARSARRHGSRVTVLALENRENLPAQIDEIREAIGEGISILAGSMVQTCRSGDKLVLDCVKVELDQQAPVGILQPVVMPEAGFSLQVDQVILAVGQDPDMENWREQLRTEKSLVAVNSGLATSRSRVFAGGDVITRQRYFSTAVGQGKQAAQAMMAEWGLLESATKDQRDIVPFSDINTFYFPATTRVEKGLIPFGMRAESFNEVKTGFTGSQAHAQAERCFSCGNCLECDNCFYFCPDMAVVKDSSLPEHYRVLTQYCKGCGCCVEECPRGAVVLKEEER